MQLLEDLDGADDEHEEHLDASGDLTGFLMTLLGKYEDHEQLKKGTSYNKRVQNAIGDSNIMRVLNDPQNDNYACWNMLLVLLAFLSYWFALNLGIFVMRL
jgi:hypothetical protein